MKLFIVSKKMSTRLSLETQSYGDFEPLTLTQVIKETLYIIKNLFEKDQLTKNLFKICSLVKRRIIQIGKLFM